MAEAGRICPYCGQSVLAGDEKPEHAIPAALGSSLVVDTVCDPCNERVGKEVDQPFLEDEWVRVHRSESGVIDPRRGRKGRPARSPLLEGYTDDGDHVSLPVDTSGVAAPTIAWKLDPARPKANGETTFDALMVDAAKRIISAADPVQGDD